jgi:hypothetical protein
MLKKNPQGKLPLIAMKRVVVNLLLAFVCIPAFILVRDFIQLDLLDDHSAYAGTFIEYLRISINEVFFIAPTLFLVLLPYNLIILKVKNLTFIKKVLLFELIMIVDICLISTYTNVLFYPYWENVYYLIYFFFYGLIFGGIIHVFVDKKIASSSEDKLFRE